MYRAIRIALFFALAYCIIYAALNRVRGAGFVDDGGVVDSDAPAADTGPL